MDHIPHPENVTPVEIPYLGDLYFRNKCIHSSIFGHICLRCRFKTTGWIKYWTRIGYDVSVLLDRRFEDLDNDMKSRLAPSMFAWLYFGVLSEYFEHTIDLRRFVVFRGPDEAYLTTRELHTILSDWHSKMARASRKRYKKWAKSVETLFAHVYMIYTTYITIHSEIIKMFPDDYLLALHLLYDILLVSKQTLDGHSGPEYNIWRLAGLRLLEQLRINNWCPSQQNRVELCVSVAYYATLFDLRDAQDHSDCDRYLCRRNQIDEAAYVVRHASGCSIDAASSSIDDSASENVSCNKDDLVRLIENDRVPLITTNADGHISVAGFRPEVGGYISVSHVWRDGGGNPRANALPRCQMRIIHSQMMYLDTNHNESMPIFLDTLCVPVGQAARTVNARKKLITKMWAIYKYASFVVVRDQGLMELSKQLSAGELIFRILFSPWFSRLWTMQEGAVAIKLKVCMADGMVDLSELTLNFLETSPHWKFVSRGDFWNGAKDIWTYLLTAKVGFDKLRDDSCDIEKRRQMVFDMAQHRRTSKEEDELMCIGGIMGFSQNQLSIMSRKSDSERTEWVVTELQRVPQWLVLCDGPRLQSRGFRWCPQRISRNWDATDAEFHDVRAGEGLYGEWKTVFFTAPLGFCNKLEREGVDRPIDLGDYIVTLRTDSGGLPGNHSSIMIGIVSEDGFEAFRALEGQPLALLTPIQLVRSNIIQRSIFVVPMMHDDFVRRRIDKSSIESSSIPSVPRSVGHQQIGYGIRQMACRAMWESDVVRINHNPAKPSISVRLLDMPDARRFWVID